MHDRLRRRSAPRDGAALEHLAQARREAPTRAERALEAILNGLAGGALAGEFRREWVCGEWILDFYFPGVRLAIEVDGRYHRSTLQLGRDLHKAAALEAAGITLVRLKNEEVFGDRERLVAKLRDGWRVSRRRARG